MNSWIKLFLLAAVVCSANPAWALRFHRCNGKIQYRPCTEVAAKQYTREKVQQAQAYARVLRSEFSEQPRQEGIWRGVVAGNGTVHLKLLIKKNGVIQSSRYMGNVALADRSTTFAFKSVKPKGSDWSWDIVAYNG